MSHIQLTTSLYTSIWCISVCACPFRLTYNGASDTLI